MRKLESDSKESVEITVKDKALFGLTNQNDVLEEQIRKYSSKLTEVTTQLNASLLNNRAQAVQLLKRKKQFEKVLTNFQN